MPALSMPFPHNQRSPWFHRSALVLLLAVATTAGCSDPSKDVHKSAATEPVASPSGAAASATPTGAKEYVVRAESTIGFVGSKVTGSHEGGFKNFAGTIHAADGKITGTPQIKINMNSTWADNGQLEGHLKSPDFFDVAKHPQTVFTVTAIEPEGATHKVTGTLELHGVSKSISFPAQIAVGDDSVTLKAEFAINRKDFNIVYPGKPDDLIRDNVVIKLDIKATPGPVRPEDQLAA